MTPSSASARARMPTFSVIGAAKAGTSALSRYLGQHPEVYLPPVGEPSFFAFEGQQLDFRGPKGRHRWDNRSLTDLADYQALFAAAATARAAGDVSPVYLYWPGTATRMKRHVPTIRVCAVLRNPVDRAFSAFMHARREDREPLHVFREALEAEPARIASNWGLLWRYVDQGFYSQRLVEYYEAFGDDQVMVILYDDFQRDPVGVCQRIADFIGVDTTFAVDTRARYNPSGLPRSQLVHGLLSHSLARRPRSDARGQPLRNLQARLLARNLVRQELRPADRRFLMQRFEPEVSRLENLLGRELSAWRS